MSVPEQATLPGIAAAPGRQRIRLDFSLDDVRRLTSKSDAFEFSLRCSGYQNKEIPDVFKMDLGQWSCITGGTKHFPHDRENEFMNVMGNEIPLIYAVEARGYDFSTLRKHQTDTERENDQLRRENADLKRALALVIDHKAAKS